MPTNASRLLSSVSRVAHPPVFLHVARDAFGTPTGRQPDDPTISVQALMTGPG
ncbi:MAG: hypothetical protein MSD82_12590 [Prevotella sp.]|nr:hypothetical protein [Prevotella sp.]